jgi:hypothetical protein
LWVGNRVGCSEGEGSVDLSRELALDARLVVQWRIGRLDIGVERLKVLRGDIGEPLCQEIILVTAPGTRLVDCQAVRLDLRDWSSAMDDFSVKVLTIDFKSRADQGREGVEELTGRIGRVDLEDQHLLILPILTTYDKQPRELLAVEQERN